MQSTLEVDAPGCVLAEERVVPGLPGGVVAHAPVGGVPWARVAGVGHVRGVEAAALDGQVAPHALAGDAAHDVDAEVEPLFVDPIS